MAKKIVKRKKIRVFRLLLVLMVLAGLFFAVYFYLNLPIKNLIVKNNNYLGDDYILEVAEVKDYPSFFLTRSDKIRKKLEKSPYIQKVKVKKKFYHILIIDVIENRPLFFYEVDKKMVLEDGNKVADNDFDYAIPRLLNYVPEDKYKDYIEAMKNVDISILNKISDIEYVPNEIDKERFLLYMDDGNMVYLTLTKFDMINNYDEVLGQVENHKGILYLDNGNYFQIKE